MGFSSVKDGDGGGFLLGRSKKSGDIKWAEKALLGYALKTPS